MADKGWKKWEREGANALGGTRTGPRGEDLPDSLDVWLLAPEFKYYKKIIWTEADWNQAVQNAARIGKIPIVAVKERDTGRRHVRIAWTDFLTLYNLAKEAHEARRSVHPTD